MMKDHMKTAVVMRIVDNLYQRRVHQGGDVDFAGVTIAIVETRMNLVHDFLLAARQQNQFCVLLNSNQKFRKYYRERTSTEKDNLDRLMNKFSKSSFWERMDVLTTHITGPLKPRRCPLERISSPHPSTQE